MNESPLSNLSPQEACLLHIAALKYLMAGDTDSFLPLTELEERRRAIDWDSPQFIQATDEMRAGIPNLTPQQEMAMGLPLLGLIHSLTERSASRDESERLAIATLKKLMTEVSKTNAYTDALADFSKELLAVAERMKDQLEVLGADTSLFEIPEFPRFPST